MKGKIGDKQRLIHILESIEEIEKYTAGENIEDIPALKLLIQEVLTSLE